MKKRHSVEIALSFEQNEFVGTRRTIRLAIVAVILASCGGTKATPNEVLTNTAVSQTAPNEPTSTRVAAVSDQITGSLRNYEANNIHEVQVPKRSLVFVAVKSTGPTRAASSLGLGTTSGPDFAISTDAVSPDTLVVEETGMALRNYARWRRITSLSDWPQSPALFSYRQHGSPTWMIFESEAGPMSVAVGPEGNDDHPDGPFPYELSVAQCPIVAAKQAESGLITRQLDRNELFRPMITALQCLFQDQTVATILNKGDQLDLLIGTRTDPRVVDFKRSECPIEPPDPSRWAFVGSNSIIEIKDGEYRESNVMSDGSKMKPEDLFAGRDYAPLADAYVCDGFLVIGTFRATRSE